MHVLILLIRHIHFAEQLIKRLDIIWIHADPGDPLQLLFICVWILNNIYKAIERLEEEARTTPAKYVRRDDYREDMHEVKSLLGKISDKLDNKEDKK